MPIWDNNLRIDYFQKKSLFLKIKRYDKQTISYCIAQGIDHYEGQSSKGIPEGKGTYKWADVTAYFFYQYSGHMKAIVI